MCAIICAIEEAATTPRLLARRLHLALFALLASLPPILPMFSATLRPAPRRSHVPHASQLHLLCRQLMWRSVVVLSLSLPFLLLLLLLLLFSFFLLFICVRRNTPGLQQQKVANRQSAIQLKMLSTHSICERERNSRQREREVK